MSYDCSLEAVGLISPNIVRRRKQSYYFILVSLYQGTFCNFLHHSNSKTIL